MMEAFIMANNNFTNTKVVTEEVRFSYVHVFEPKAVAGSDEEKYSVSLIIPKSDTNTLKKIDAAIEEAKKAGLTSKFGGKIPPNLKLPLRDGDIDRFDDEAYANSFFVNANCSRKPGLVDKRGNPITDPEELYSGCYGRASITFFAYNSNGSKGIACGLNNLMKTRDGESLGGRVSAETDFAGYFESGDDLL
jgi:hypothetical protein